MKKRVKTPVYASLIAPNGARVKIRNFKAWSQEIQLRLVFNKATLIKLDNIPF